MWLSVAFKHSSWLPLHWKTYCLYTRCKVTRQLGNPENEYIVPFFHIFKSKIFLLFEILHLTNDYDCLYWYYFFFENLKLYNECFITWKKETSQSINIFLQSFTTLYVHKVQKSYKHILEMLRLKCLQQTSFSFISLFSDPDLYFYINSCL